MKPYAVFHSTRVFAWIKFGLCFFMMALAVGVFALTVGLAMPVSKVLGWFLFVLWLVLCAVVGFFFKKRALSFLEASHISAISRCYTTGRIDPEQFDRARAAAHARFRSVKGYLQLHRICYRSVRQQQIYFETVTDEMDDVAGMKTLLSIGLYIKHLMLRFVADACIGYICWCRDLNVFAAMREAVAVYAYNWHRLTDKAGEQAFAMIASTLVGAALAAFGLTKLFVLFGLSKYTYLAVLLGIVLVLSLRYAFLDSYYTCASMKALLDNAQATVLSDDLYDRLKSISPAYRKVCALADRRADGKKRLPPPKAQT